MFSSQKKAMLVLDAFAGLDLEQDSGVYSTRSVDETDMMHGHVAVDKASLLVYEVKNHRRRDAAKKSLYDQD